jgi:hypothetical protein
VTTNRGARRLMCRLVGCGLLFVATSSFGQTISVLVLNVKNRRGLRDAAVWLQFYEAPGSHRLRRVLYKTGRDGVATLQLPDVKAAQLTISASLPDSFCEDVITAATVDILEHGAVSRCNPKTNDAPRTASPGQVIFLLRRMPLWYRILAPLERE